MRNAHKKSVAFSPSSDVLRSSTTYYPQLQRTSPRITRNAVALSGDKLKVSKFQDIQISYFAFSYSMMCILIYALCFIGICIR